MVTVNHAILHIMDTLSCMTILSEEELFLKDDITESYIQKHTQRCFKDADMKSGTFSENSSFLPKIKEYTNKDCSFVDFSRAIANEVFDCYSRSYEVKSCDLIISDVLINAIPYLVLLKCNNALGFIHQVDDTTGKIKNGIERHYAILPTTSHKIPECFFINLNDYSIKLKEKNKVIDGFDQLVFTDILLQCDTALSARETVTLVNEVTEIVAEKYQLDPVEAITKAKNYTLDTVEESDELDPVAMSKVVFPNNPAIQESFEEEITSAGITEPVKVEKSFIMRNRKNHKIITDTGIEITFPVDCFNEDYIHFVNHPDGKISIELKNISNIENK